MITKEDLRKEWENTEEYKRVEIPFDKCQISDVFFESYVKFIENKLLNLLNKN